MPPLDDQLKLAFEYASELAKQMITLSTGALAISITFTKDIVNEPSRWGLAALKLSWVLLLLSTIAGVWTLAALTGSLAPVGGGTPTTIGSNVRYPAMAQEILFVLGVISITLYGLFARHRPKREGEAHFQSMSR